MYIRRKVFSLAVDKETGEEKLFSTTDIQSQKEFSEKKAQKDKDTKAEKAAKATTIGGATVGLGAGVAGLSLDTKKLGKKIEDYELKKGALDNVKEVRIAAGLDSTVAKRDSDKLAKKIRTLKIAEKASKHSGKIGLAGVGTSIGGGIVYKALKKKKDQKEFAESEKKEDGKKVKTAGKIMAGTGAALYTGARSAEAIAKSKALKMIERKGADLVGDSLKFRSQEDAESAEKFLRNADKALKVTNKTKKLGLALGAAGAGTYLVGRHKSKKNSGSSLEN